MSTRRTIRKVAGIAALVAAAASLAMAPAGAQEPVEVTYGASSTGEALVLDVFKDAIGQRMTIGRTVTGLDSTLAATAEGVGIASPLFEGGISSAQIQGEGADGSLDETCEFELDQVPGLRIELACSSSHVAVADGLPTSTATGRVGTIAVNPVQPILDTELAAVVETVEQEGVNALLDGLRPVTSGVDGATGLGVEDTLDDLFGALFAGADLVTINLGTTVANSAAVTDSVSTKCTSSGGRIDVLDLPENVEGVNPPPVMSLVIGDAGAAVDVDTTTGEAVPTVNPAIVTVVVPSMGIEQPVGPGQTIEIPLPEPLGTSIIQVADGTTGVDDNGQTFAKANAVFLDLLNGEAMQGGIELNLAACSAVGGAAITQIPTTTTAPPSLPRTGGGPSDLALIGALGFAGLGAVLLRRNALAD